MAFYSCYYFCEGFLLWRLVFVQSSSTILLADCCFFIKSYEDFVGRKFPILNTDSMRIFLSKSLCTRYCVTYSVLQSITSAFPFLTVYI